MSVLADRLLPWFERHGRHDLPWQRPGDPYATWVSEIMLQQTQVATVIPYFERFMQSFPTVAALAAAPLDAVLAHWSGLGYYARARNLHRAARMLATEHGGAWPRTLEAWQALPGIGRSTAGAILALAYGLRHPILDGNVKRVLVRFHGLEAWPGEPATVRTLWSLAETHTPSARVAEYTQAIMDLGATLCTRTRPRCSECPLTADCVARQQARQHLLPRPRPRRARPQRETHALVVQDSAGRVLLERRPAVGIWGGLFSLPELSGPDAAADWTLSELGRESTPPEPLEPIAHAFTHFDLTLHILRVRIGSPAVAHGAGFAESGTATHGTTFNRNATGTMPAAAMARERREIECEPQGLSDRVWYEAGTPPGVGLAAPIQALLGRMLGNTSADRAGTRRIRRGT